ncbi:hypothetical protein NI17_015425 [Thermobifida halotolerans]|uniref:Uncharacterized protein n=1 Tax=Thermobifida halotolerans TaxID=483545 RepID=A0AA97M2R8_9ACTN|nr:hypothetical protein [Thermobifida halotolerans]UOE18227.1 hypothetical protein NI17_015425 [Thermobifida halotolerans]
MNDEPAARAAASKRLLAQYEAEFDLDETQRAALALAGEHLDNAERLDGAVREHGTMIRGSAGQLVVNPAVAEARHQRSAAWNILRALTAEDAGAVTDAASMGQASAGGAARSPASVRASEAARKRWERARALAAADADGVA